MTTLIVRIEDGAETKDIAAAVRLLKGVADVAVRKDEESGRIPGLPYTDQERIASVRRSVEEYKTTGVSYSTEELKSRMAEW